MAGEADVFVLLCLAFIFPPAAVAFISGCGPDLCCNFLLTLIGWLPGCIHAFWLVLRRSEANERYGYGNWTYKGMGEYYARGEAPPPPGPPPPSGPPGPTQEQYPPPKPKETQDQQTAQQPSTDQKKSEYTSPPAPAGTTKSGDYPGPPSAPAPADTKSSGYPGPPPGPAPADVPAFQ